MVVLESFGERKALVEQLLQGLNRQLTAMLGEEACFELVAGLDAGLLARMLALEEEVFRIEDNVYSEADIRECLAEEDSLLMVLRIRGRVEGYIFGYDDEPSAPVVAGTDYFMDSAVISLAYQKRGLGSHIGLVVLLLVYLLGYHSLGINTERRDRSGRELVGFYRKLGFVEAPTVEPESVGMKIELNRETIGRLVHQLPAADALASILGV